MGACIGLTLFRFIHAADLHLDTPFSGLIHMPENILQQIRESTFRAFDRLIEICIEEQADFLCLSGDIYEQNLRSLRAQIHLQKGLCRLRDHGIRAYIIHGNHDPDDGSKASLAWPENVHFFSSQQVEAVPFLKEGKIAATIYGQSYPTAKFTKNIVKNYMKRPDCPFAIGLLHTNLEGHPEHDNYAPAKMQDLLQAGFDYWALGHIHKRGILSDKHPAVVYPGNTQGRNIKETGEKGCYAVEVSNNEIREIRFIPTHFVRWEQIAAGLEQTETMQDVLDRLYIHIEQIKTSVNTPLILRLLLTGETNMHFEIKQPGVLQDLADSINEEFIRETNWVWIESIQAYTRPPLTMESLKHEDPFLADFFTIIDEWKKDPGVLEEMMNRLFAHRNVRKHLPRFTDEELWRVIEEAENLMLQFLWEKGGI